MNAWREYYGFHRKEARTITQVKIIKTHHNKRVKSKVNLILNFKFYYLCRASGRKKS